MTTRHVPDIELGALCMWFNPEEHGEQTFLYSLYQQGDESSARLGGLVKVIKPVEGRAESQTQKKNQETVVS